MSDSPPDSVPPRETRSSVFLRALVDIGEGAVECRVHNISMSGACIDNVGNLTPDRRVLVTMGMHHHLKARICWSSDGRAGLLIDGEEIDIAKARRPRGTVAEQSAQGAGWLADIDDPYRRR
jgi:PilZ domain